MRPTALPMLVFVLLFGSALVLAPGATAQSSASFQGQVCSEDWNYGEPYIDDGRGECFGGPLSGATVEVTSKDSVGSLLGSSSDTTDEQGSFNIGGLSDGSYGVEVTRTGFETVEFDIEVEGSTYRAISLPGETVTAQATAVDEDEEPVEGVFVSLYGRDRKEATTDADGAISVSMTAGWYNVEASHPEMQQLYDYILIDGQAPFTLPMLAAPERTAQVVGHVEDQDGAPVEGARVEAYQYGYPEAYEDCFDCGRTSYYYDSGSQSTTTDANGDFTLDLYAGHVNLNLYKEGHASAWTDFEIDDGETRNVELTMQKYPEKTAHITGRITNDAGDGLRFASISIQSPVYGLYECSTDSSRGSSAESGGTDSSEESDAVEPAASPPPGETMVMEHYRDPGCAITVHPDGSFEGNVTPGYSIFRVYYDHYRSCSETRNSDGSGSRDCGPDYFAHVRTLTLAEDSDTRIDIQLVQRPGPDATLSGYVVDDEQGTTIPGARVSFSNQDNYGYGWAETDGDGSYKVRMRSGYLQVSVWAEGYLPWEGTVQLASGDDKPLDIRLTAGEASYGGCCIAYAEDRAVSSDGAQHSPAPATAPSEDAKDAGAGSGTVELAGDGDAPQFEDLGGGLGPYDPQARAKALEESQGTPSLALVWVALAGLALAARRR